MLYLFQAMTFFSYKILVLAYLSVPVLLVVQVRVAVVEMILDVVESLILLSNHEQMIYEDLLVFVQHLLMETVPFSLLRFKDTNRIRNLFFM